MKILSKNDLKSIKRNYDVSKLEEEQKKQIIFSSGYYNIEWFSDVFLEGWKKKDNKFIKSAVFHKEIWSNLDIKGDMVVICPRWHAKTTVLLIYIIHALLYRKYTKIMYIASVWLWEESIWRIREQLENNENIKYIFGELVPKEDRQNSTSKKWRQKQLELLNDTIIETIPKGGSVRWKRPNFIVVDDLEEHKDICKLSLAEKTRRWFFTALYNTLLPWWKIIVLWTIVGEMCLIKYIKEEKKWRSIQYQALKNNIPLWADMWSYDLLQERKKQIWTAMFDQEFMNIPLVAWETIIKKAWIRRYTEKIKCERIVCWVDPALSTKELADFTWIVVMWKSKWNKYVLYSDNFKGSISQLINRLNDIYKMFNIRSFYVENIWISDTLIRANISKARLPVVCVNPKWKDKGTRLREVSWQIEFWKVLFWGELVEDLIDQLVLYPDTPHDDLVDAFIYSCNALDIWDYTRIKMDDYNPEYMQDF